MEILETGRWRLLDRLREDLDPVAAFQTLPGIGPALAAEIHETLDVENLEELEVAANDGRLREVPGIGAQPRRGHPRRPGGDLEEGPRQAPTPAGGRSPKSRPFSRSTESTGARPPPEPSGRSRPAATTPMANGGSRCSVCDAVPGSFTAMFSNSARAHILERTRDWVVISYSGDDGAEGQVTVVTERRGPMASHRVVRGRELRLRGFLQRRRCLMCGR